MADIQLIKGAANGNPSDSLPIMYDKVNKNTANINTQVVNHEGRLGTAEAAVSNHGSRLTVAEIEIVEHEESAVAHAAEHITYDGAVIGASNMKQAVDLQKSVVDSLVISGDSSPAAAQAKVDTFGVDQPTLKDRLDKDYLRTAAQLAETAFVANRTTLNLRRGITSHRGLQSVAPENTIRAIAEAGRRGYVLVELDPQFTVDGVCVVIHDEKVDRTTDGTGTVSLMTWAEIQALKIDAPAELISADEVYRVPTLEDALKEIAYWGMGVNIDGSKFIVHQENITYIAGLLDKYGLTEKSWIVGPTYANRQVIKTYAPNVAVGWTTTVENVDADIAEAAQYKAALLAINSTTLTAEAIAKCNAAGVFIMAYTANDLKTAYQWLNRGVSFVETDYVLPGSVV